MAGKLLCAGSAVARLQRTQETSIPMKKAFTLIELLVVIAIIAILAAILFPVFAQAKLAAKKAADLSNVKQMSLGIIMYSGDQDDMYPSAYFHRAFNPALGGVVGGYIHWSGMIMPYVKNNQLFVSPVDSIGGNAPTCYASANNNSGAGAPPGQNANICAAGFPGAPASGGFIFDEQVPRLSYTVNSAVIPRLRNITDVARGITVVSQTALDSPANTIQIAGLIDNNNCLNGQSISGTSRNSSHRSTNALTRDGVAGQYFGSAEDAGGVRPATIFAIDFNVARTQMTDCRTTPLTSRPLITYHSGFRFNNQGDNYGFADGSAKYRAFGQTLAPSNFQWGARVFTDGGAAVINPATGLQVTN